MANRWPYLLLVKHILHHFLKTSEDSTFAWNTLFYSSGKNPYKFTCSWEDIQPLVLLVCHHHITTSGYNTHTEELIPPSPLWWVQSMYKLMLHGAHIQCMLGITMTIDQSVHAHWEQIHVCCVLRLQREVATVHASGLPPVVVHDYLSSGWDKLPTVIFRPCWQWFVPHLKVFVVRKSVLGDAFGLLSAK